MWRLQCDKCKRMMDAAEQGAHYEIGVTGRREDAGDRYDLCPSCYRTFQGLMGAFLSSEGPDWSSVYGATTVTITDDGVQTRIDDSSQPWNAEGGQ